jgi:hypothetical protein
MTSAINSGGTYLYGYPSHWKLKIIRYLGNDRIRDYWLCEGDEVFMRQNDYEHHMGKLENINGEPWRAK